MKRVSFFLSALAVALFSSCNKEEAPVANDAIFGTVPVTVEQPIDPSTKVSINESGDSFTLSLTDTDFFGLTQCATLSSNHSYKKWTYSNGNLSGEIPSDYSGSYLVILGYQDEENSYSNGLGGGANTIRGTISDKQKSSSVKGLLIAKTEECAAGEMPSVFNFKTMNSFLKFSVKKSEEAGNATLETITITSPTQIAGQFGFQADNVNLEAGFNDDNVSKKLYAITLDCEHASLSADNKVFYASLAYGELDGLTVTFTFSDESTIVKTIGKNSGVTLERNTVYALPVITYTGTGSSNPGQEEETATADFIFNTDEGLAALEITKPGANAGVNVGSSTYSSDVIEMSFTDGGTATRIWNSNGSTSLRVYKAGTGNNKQAGSITFSGATITKIEFTGSSLGGFETSVGNYSNGTWSGSATSVTFTANANVTINTVKVTYAKGESNPEPQPTTYTVSIANNIANGTVTADPMTAAEGTTVTLTADPENGYAFDSWIVTNASTSAAITVTDNKFTMPAADVNVSATFVEIPTYLTTIDQIFEAATDAGSTATDTNVTFDNWVVSGVKGSNAYVTDNAGKGFIIYQSSHGFVTGDILSGSVACKVQLYNGSAELTSLTSTTTGLSVTKGGVVTPVSTIALASLSGVNTGAVLSYEGLEYNGTNFTDGATSLKPYNGLITLPTLISGKNYNVTGVYVQYRETKEIAPRTAEDFELVEVINNFVVTFDATENGTIVVKDGETVINDGDEVAEGTTLSVECTPASGYRFKNGQYKAGEAAWATRTTNPQSYMMPSANVQFRATFEEIPVYTIAWSVNGSIIKTESLEAGAAVETPNVDNPAGKEFCGWITSAIDGTTNEAPNFVTPSSTAIASVTYYAVFSSSAGEVTEELTNAEVDGLSSSSNLSYTKEKKYTDGTVEYSIQAYTDGNRKWMQLKKDSGSFVKMTAPMPIKRVELTITSATNSSGGINDITKHTAYSGTVALCAADCTYTTSSKSVASNSTITNNVATLNPSGDNTSLYLKVSTGARVWTISVTYGSYSYFTSF